MRTEVGVTVIAESEGVARDLVLTAQRDIALVLAALQQLVL